MDIPLPDEIPLPCGGGDDNQPGVPGEGPPSRQRPMGRGNFHGSHRSQGPPRMHQPRDPSPALIPPPMFQGPVPPFMRGPPPNARPDEHSSRTASERYSPSRVTGDDDEKEQLSISAIFDQEQNLQNLSQRPSMPSSQSSSQPQQSISAIFDSFLTPPPQNLPPMPPHSHEHPPRNQYHPPMPPQFPMGGQHPLHGGPPMMPTGPPGIGGPPRMPIGPPGAGHHGGMPPHPPGPPSPYYIRPPPYQPYTSAPVSRPPFTPTYTPAPSNKMTRPFRSALRPSSSYFQSSKSKASKILKSFNTQNALNTQGRMNESSGPEVDVVLTLDTSSLEGGAPSNSKTSVSESEAAADSTVASLSSENPPPEDLEQGKTETGANETPPGVNVTTGATSTDSPVSSSENVSLSASEMAAKAAANVTIVNSGTTLSDKPVKKVMPKVLGKHGAKKRLLSYTGKLSAFSLAKTTKQTAVANLDEDDESAEKKKTIMPAKKKKKEEKMSSIEQIRNEESRLKEALGLKNVLFSPYGPGLAPIAKLLDNPEELRKFEDRGKQAKIKLEEYEVRSKIREEQVKLKEKVDREKEREKKIKEREDKEKERDKEERNVEENKMDVPDGAGEESKVEFTSKVEHEEEKKSCILPKTWKEFKNENYDFETLRQVVKDELKKKGSRSYDRSRTYDSYSRDRRESRQDGRESRPDESNNYEQNRTLNSVQLKSLNGMRLQYPAKLVQYTKARPILSYGINYHRFTSHFASRTEVKVKELPETIEILEEFWSAKPVYPPRRKHGKGKETCRPWFAESLEGKSVSKTKVEPDDKEEEVEKQKKTEKKSKKSHSRLKTSENQQEVPRTVDVKSKVNQEVAKAATKSRWDSDNEERDDDLYGGIGLEDESLPTPSKSDHKISTEEDVITENELISSDNNTNNAEGEAPTESSGKPFPEGLNEEYEAFLEMVGGESELKDHEKEEGLESFMREMESRNLANRGKEEIEDKKDLDGEEEEKDKDQEDKQESEEVKVGDENSELVGNQVQEKKKDKADRKLKKQLKKAKKKQKKAKKKAKKKVKKLVKKKKVSKKDKEAKKSEKKAVPVEIDDESEVLIIPVNDDDEQVDDDDNKENISGRRRRDSGNSRDHSEERHRDYSDRRRDSEGRSSAERSEYSERRRRDSPERRGNYDRRRGFDDKRDFNQRREGRGYFRGRGGDWRRDDFGDHRGRFRGRGGYDRGGYDRGGYDRRGRGRGFGRGGNFRDRRDASFRERRNEYDERKGGDERVYERTEDYEVHREFIREKRYERKEALEEGRDLRKERLEKRKREKYQRKAGSSYSPARTISDESDSDIQSIDPNEEIDERMNDFHDKVRSTRNRKEKRIPSPAPSPLSSPSSSPERSRISNEELPEEEEEEEDKVGEKKERFWDLEASNTSPSMKSKESSPSHSIEIVMADDKRADSAPYTFSDTSGYYDLSSAPSPLSEPDSTRAEDESLESSKKKQRSRKDLEFKLDDIPYPPGGPAVDRKRRDSNGGSQSLNDRYSPSNMSVSGSPDTPSPYNSPRSESPSLEIPLPPSLLSIPVPPITNRTSTVESSKLEGISLLPAGIPLPSSSPLARESTEVPNLAIPKPIPAAMPGKRPGSPVKSSSLLSPLSASQNSSGPSATSGIPSLVSVSGAPSLPSPVLAAISKTLPEMKESVARPFVKESLESAKTVLSSKFQEALKSISLFPAAVVSPTASDSEAYDILELKQPYKELKDEIRNDKPNLKSDYKPTKWVEKSVDESHIDSPSIEDVKSSRSMPITFRLGGSKQATIKRLQMGAVLAGFDHDEEEEEEKIGLDLDRGDDEDKADSDSELVKGISDEALQDSSEFGPPGISASASQETLDSSSKEQLQEDVKEREGLDRSRSRSLEKEHPLRGSLSPQRTKAHSHKDMSPRRSPSLERSKSPKSTRSHYKSRSPPRIRSPVRSRSPQRNRSPKRNRSPRRSRDSRSRSLSPRRIAGRRSPPRKRRVSPEFRRYRGSPERGRRREFGSPRRTGRWPRDGRSPPPRAPGPRSGKERSPKRFSRSPSPIKGDRYTSPDSRHSRTPEKLHAPAAQGPRTPEGPKFSRSPPRIGSPHRDREFRGNYKEKLGSRSPNRPPSPESLGRRPYASPPGSRKIRKEYRSSRSPGSRSPERWLPRRHSPSRRSPSWSPNRKRVGSPFRKSPPLQKSRCRSPYSPGREKGSPARRWSPVRSRSPRRSPLRKSPLRRPLKRRSTSRSPVLRSRSRSPMRRSASRSPVRRSPLRRSPRWSRSPSRRSPVRRSPIRRSPSRRSPVRSPLRRSPIRRSPLRRSPLRRSPSRKSPIRKSPRRSPRSSRSPSKDFDYEHRERGGWSNWKWEKAQEEDHKKDKERWPIRPPSPKEEATHEKYYKNKADRKEGTLKIDADSTISDSELVIKKEPVDSPSPSPHSSPQRLSLDERLQQEHGLELEDNSKKQLQQQPSHPPVYNWGYQGHPVQVHQFQYAYEGNSEGGAGEGGTGDGSSRVIQVGNMLQVLPQDGTPGNMLKVLPQERNTGNMLKVLPQERNTGTPSPMIVQTGNVIQVVPAENMQMLGTDVVSSIPVSSSGVMGMGGVVQVVTGGGMLGVPGSSPTPVPVPAPTTPVAAIKAINKSAVSDEAVAAVSSVLSSLSSIQLPGASVLSSASSLPSQTPATPATLATNSVPATTSAHAPGLPVAHLISLLQQQQQMASMNDSAIDQEAISEAKEKSREARRERKEKRRIERETRRESRQKEKETYRRKQEQETKKKTEENNSDTEDEVLIREAIYEVPTIGSPVPDYEIMKDEDDEEDEEESMLRKKRRLPIPLPPAEKGILMSPSYRYRDEYHPKAVKFADGILPGEGTSPSGGEEIQSPPPPGDSKPKEKKLRKRRKVKVKMIKEYKVNDEGDDAPPPPPPGSPPPLAALKLYPGYTHYSYSAPGTVVIYAQQPQQAYAYASGQTQGTITVPSGMIIKQGANAQPTQAALGSLGGASPGVFRYPGYVYTTVYSAGQQLQYVLPSSLASQPASTSSSSPKKKRKK